MTLKTALLQGRKLLEEGGIAAPQLTAQVLLGHALGVDRAYLYAHSEDELSELGWIHYGRYLHQRLGGTPTQYITKRQEFYGREFVVGPGVLIPRPETEGLVESVLERARPGARILDVGTGSGCIAATLALELGTTVWATEISWEAMGIARGNVSRLGAEVRLASMDLGSAFADGSFDRIVSNPPYVPDGDAATLAREVREFEPAAALFGGMDGLDYYRRLESEGRRLLRYGGTLHLEFGIGQTAALLEIFREWVDVDVRADLAGIDRVLSASRGG